MDGQYYCITEEENKNHLLARSQWLTPIILDTQEQRARGSRFETSSGKQFLRPYLEKTHHKKEAGGVAQGVGLSSSPSTTKKNQLLYQIGPT
jgi:hypothetical protein